MKALLIGGGILFALYVLSQNQPNPPLSTAPVASAAPPATTVTLANNLAVSNVPNPGFDLAYEGAAGACGAPPAGQDFVLNPAIRTGNTLRLAPAWLRIQPE